MGKKDKEKDNFLEKTLKKHRVTFILLSLFVSLILVFSIFTYVVVIDDNRCQLFSFNVDPGGEDQNENYYSSVAPHNFDEWDLIRTDRIGDFAVSPSGEYVAFFRKIWSTKANVTATSLWITRASISLYRKRIIPFQWGVSGCCPTWDSSSNRIYFLSNRSGSMQIWSVSKDGTGLAQKSDYPLDVEEILLEPKSSTMVFSMSVFPIDPESMDTDADISEKKKMTSKNMKDTANLIRDYKNGRVDGYGKLTGIKYENLDIRNWDRWSSKLRRHIFLVEVYEDKKSLRPQLGDPVDIIIDWDADAPTIPFGDSDEWSFSKDGRNFAFTIAPNRTSWVYNQDICIVDVKDYNVTMCLESPTAESRPRFSPISNSILAFVRTEEPNYFYSKRAIFLYNFTTKECYAVASGWDRSVIELRWSAEGTWLYFTALIEGSGSLFRIDPLLPDSTPVLYSVGTHSIVDLLTHPEDSDAVVALYSELLRPPDIQLFSSGSHIPLTSFNTKMLSKCQFSDPGNPKVFVGAEGDLVSAWVIRPTNMLSGVRYPLLVVIHGGPQLAELDAWSFSWNPEIMAGKGYYVLMINFHGSSGYGQEFCDSVQGDWGGKPYDDIMLGIESLYEDQVYGSTIDFKQLFAIGFGYGGYLVNWINGRTNDFRALINYGGVFDTHSMYYQMDELFLPERDFYGPDFEYFDVYEEWNPLINVTQWTTPTLVIHTGKNYRHSLSQAISTFNLMKRRGLQSKFLYFPDEGPRQANLIFFYSIVSEFLAEFQDSD